MAEVTGDEVTVTPDEIIRHPSYNAATLNNDICLIYIEEPITFDEKVTPVCLPPMVQLEDDRPQTGETCYVAGWGRLHETGKSATKLQELAVDIIDYETCNTQESYDGLIQDDTMLCAGFLEGGKDACQGDSGGPLVSEK